MPSRLSSAAAKSSILFTKIKLKIRPFSSSAAFSDHFQGNPRSTAPSNSPTPGKEMEKSIHTILTVNRWESLNRMDYRTALLRPVHGRLALKILKWAVKEPGLELTHVVHVYCITAHVLIRARMYDSARLVLSHVSDVGFTPKSVLDALMTTYRICKSNPSVFEVLIRVHLRKGKVLDALEVFSYMCTRKFRPSIDTCNMILGFLMKGGHGSGSGRVWLLFKEMMANNVCPNVRTFNVLLQALCVEGKFKEAAHLLNKMEESGYLPNVVTYNTLLNWYCKRGRYKAAFELMDRMSSKGVESDVCTYNLLIDELCRTGKSGKGYLLLRKMRKKLRVPNEVTYNTIINGFVKEDNLRVAARVFKEMLSLKLRPNRITYNSLIDGYSRYGNFEEALYLLRKMERRGLKPDEVSYGGVLNGLCKHGKLHSARYLLDRMRVKGILVSPHSYTMLIDGLCKNGDFNGGMEVFDVMREDGVYPDVITYSVFVNRFFRAGMVSKVKEVICKMYRSGVFLNKTMYRTLLYHFCQMRDIGNAMKVYEVMHMPDHFVCNSLVSCLCKLGKVEEAEEVMQHMNKIGIIPNSTTFDMVIGCYGEIGDGLKSFSLFDKMIDSGNRPSSYTYQNLLKSLCKGGNLELAVTFFEKLQQIPFAVDTSVYNVLFGELSKSGNLHLTLHLLDEMVRKGVFPDQYTYTTVLNAFCRKGKMVPAMMLFGRETYSSSEVIAYTCIIDGLFKSGNSKVAGFFYDEMVKKGVKLDIAALNTMIDGYSRTGQVARAGSYTSCHNLTTYNILLHGNAKLKNVAECFTLYGSIISQGLCPDKLTYHSLILGLCETGMLDLGVKFLKKMILEGVTDVTTLKLLIARFCDKGEMEKAFELLNISSSIGVLVDGDVYGFLLKGFRRTLNPSGSLVILKEMLEKGLKPTERQYSSLITGLCRAGRVRDAFKFKDEIESLGLSSKTIAESAMVRGLARRGKTGEAVFLLECMLRGELVPTLATFTTVMHRLCSESDISKALELKSLMELHGTMPDTAAYNVLITGLCASGDFLTAFDLYEEMKRRRICPNIATFNVLTDAVMSVNSSSVAELLILDLQNRGLVSEVLGSRDWCNVLMDTKEKLRIISKTKGSDSCLV